MTYKLIVGNSFRVFQNCWGNFLGLNIFLSCAMAIACINKATQFVNLKSVRSYRLCFDKQRTHDGTRKNTLNNKTRCNTP